METNIFIEEKDIGSRLDVLIHKKFNLKSREEAKKIIEQTNNMLKKKLKPSHLVKFGESFKIYKKNTLHTESKLFPEPDANIELDIKFEDEHIAIINKQANLSVHLSKSEQSNTLVNAILYRYGSKILQIGEPERAGIVHRIDKDTTGLIVIAKSQSSYEKLKTKFLERSIKKTYIAIIYGVMNPLSGTLSNFISKSKNNYKKFCISDEGKLAITHYKTIKIIDKMSASILELTLETGRTHQIRCQLENAGNSIIGDKLYSKNKLIGFEKKINPEKIIKRQALHSKSIEFSHPINGSNIKIDTDLPQDMQNLINLLNH